MSTLSNGIIDLTYNLGWLAICVACWGSQIYAATRGIFAYGKLTIEKNGKGAGEGSESTWKRWYRRLAYTSHALGFAVYYIFAFVLILSLTMHALQLVYARVTGKAMVTILDQTPIVKWLHGYHLSKANWSLQHCGFQSFTEESGSILPRKSNETIEPDLICLLSNFIIPNLDALILCFFLTIHIGRRLLETFFVHRSSPATQTSHGRNSNGRHQSSPSRQHILVTAAGLVYYFLVVLLPIQGSTLFAYPQPSGDFIQRIESGLSSAMVIPKTEQPGAKLSTLPQYPSLVPSELASMKVNYSDPALKFSTQLLAQRTSPLKNLNILPGEVFPTPTATKALVESADGKTQGLGLEASAYAMGLPSPALLARLITRMSSSGFAGDSGFFPLQAINGFVSSAIFHVCRATISISVRLYDIATFLFEYGFASLFSTPPWTVSKERWTLIRDISFKQLLRRLLFENDFPVPLSQSLFKVSLTLSNPLLLQAPELFVAGLGSNSDVQARRTWQREAGKFVEAPYVRVLASVTAIRYIFSIILFILGSVIQAHSHVILARLRSQDSKNQGAQRSSSLNILDKSQIAPQKSSEAALIMRAANILAPTQKRPQKPKRKATTPLIEEVSDSNDADADYDLSSNELSTADNETISRKQSKDDADKMLPSEPSKEIAENTMCSEEGQSEFGDREPKPDWNVSVMRTDASRFYKIPYGGLFQFVSCPHYLGEIIIYLSFVILMPQSIRGASLDDMASIVFSYCEYLFDWQFGIPMILRDAGSLGLNLRTLMASVTLITASMTSPTAIFCMIVTLSIAMLPSPTVLCFIWVCSNLSITALKTHEWYKNTFPYDYPNRRKAIIPFVL